MVPKPTLVIPEACEVPYPGRDQKVPSGPKFVDRPKLFPNCVFVNLASIIISARLGFSGSCLISTTESSFLPMKFRVSKDPRPTWSPSSCTLIVARLNGLPALHLTPKSSWDRKYPLAPVDLSESNISPLILILGVSILVLGCVVPIPIAPETARVRSVSVLKPGTPTPNLVTLPD